MISTREPRVNGVRLHYTVVENAHGGVVANCGHFIPEEQPEELARLLSAFWAETAQQKLMQP